ncbi:hypothetical protein [Aeromonas cavernicola]|uniref:Uncharacterized protein n=1 Tax=Aeromonas cavernicola TaxID=1006623 RepID=A0A2H9U6K3_9GAMM|nr:hypothetical protein [Aeromonas cavernicola]PJG59632.1 hypothetical protein CUC53_06255 [Aeromonas cavernicola]
MPILLLLFISFISTAQEYADYSIQSENGKLFFVDKVDPDIGDKAIAVFFNDKIKGEYFVDFLPYLSSKGKIKNAFYVNTKNIKKRYIIIQESQIDSDTGMNWFNYFNVIVFSYADGRLSRDDKLTSYFGSGGDITNPNVLDAIPYHYPYSERDEIINVINKSEFNDWITGNPATLKIKRKSYFFSEPLPINKGKSYLIENDKVLRKAHESGWDYVIYKSPKGRTYSGWMSCYLTGSC